MHTDKSTLSRTFTAPPMLRARVPQPAHARLATHSSLSLSLSVGHDLLRSHLQVLVDHQRRRVRLRWTRSMMSIVTVRTFAGSEEASGVSTRGIELFAWVRAGGRALGPCAGYEAAAAHTERRQLRIAECAISAMAHSRHGRVDRLAVPLRPTLCAAAPPAVFA